MVKKPEKPPIVPLPPGKWPETGLSMLQERLIGRTVAAWAQLEAAMQDLLWALLSVDIDDGRILSARTDAGRLLQWIRAFAIKRTSGAELASLQTILAAIEIAQDDRNFIVHGTWFILKPDGIPMASSVKAKAPPGEFTSESFPEDRMRTIIHNVRVARTALTAWRERHVALRDRSSPQPPMN